MNLNDALWIFGSVTAFAVLCIVSRLAYDRRQVLFGVWEQAKESGLIRINLVKDFEGEGEGGEDQTRPDEQTDRADRRPDGASSGDLERKPRLAVDRTRQAVMEELLTLGWTVTELRTEGIFRGDNTKISAEVEEARQRLGLEQPVPYRTPIAGREVKRDLFYPEEPELEYKAP